MNTLQTPRNQKIIAAMGAGFTAAETAEQVGVSKATVYRVVKESQAAGAEALTLSEQVRADNARIIAEIDAAEAAEDAEAEATGGWEELSTETVTDMSEAFAADEEAEAIVLVQVAPELEPAVKAIKKPRKAKKGARTAETVLAEIAEVKADRKARNLLFQEGSALGITLTALGAAAGVSRYSVADALTALAKKAESAA